MQFFRFANGDPNRLKTPLTLVVAYYGLFAAILLGSLFMPPGNFTARFVHSSAIKAASQILPYMQYNQQLAETAPGLYGKSLLIKAVLLGGSLLPTLLGIAFLVVSTAFICLTRTWKYFAAIGFMVFFLVPTLEALTSRNPSILPRGNLLYDALGAFVALLPFFSFLVIQFVFVTLATIIVWILLPRLLFSGTGVGSKARKAE